MLVLVVGMTTCRPGLTRLGAAEAVLPSDIWNPASHRPLSENEETDNPRRLLSAALHAFNAVNAAGPRFRQKDVKRAADLIGRAYRVTRRKDPVITTMYAMINLWAAGRSERLVRRIRHSTTGINAFDNAKSLAPDNLEIRALRLISAVGVPPSFRDLTESLIADGEWFLALGGGGSAGEGSAGEGGGGGTGGGRVPETAAGADTPGAGGTEGRAGSRAAPGDEGERESAAEAGSRSAGGKLSEVERAVWESYRPAVAAVMAECMARIENEQKVREYLDMVPPGGLDGPRFAGVRGLYERLVRERG